MLYSEDRRGKRSSNIQMRNFLDWVTKFALIDISIKKLQYTWSNFRAQPLCSKIDWFFSTSEWMVRFPKTSLQGLLWRRLISNHCPLFLNTDIRKDDILILRICGFATHHSNGISVLGGTRRFLQGGSVLSSKPNSRTLNPV